MRRRGLVAGAAALVVLTGGVAWAGTRHQDRAATPSGSVTLADQGVLVHDVDSDRLALVTADGVRHQTRLDCLRVSATHRRAVCLGPDPRLPGQFVLTVLDEHLAPVRTVALHGIPSRARITADGRMVAWTTFSTGDSYAVDSYSTRTGILDLATGRQTTDLESFRVDGRVAPVDANFWGVTFAADDTTFYATMLTQGRYDLVRGDFARAEVRTVASGVECPSLSPDGTRLVYKKRLPDQSWQLWVLELATGHRTHLPTPRSVDDQAVWLDDATVAFAMADVDDRPSVYRTTAGGRGPVVRMIRHAESPAPLSSLG